jgi:hypothetical protein
LSRACDQQWSAQPIGQFALLIRDSLQNGQGNAIDMGKVDAILKDAKSYDRPWICAMAGMLLCQHGQEAAAKSLFKNHPVDDPFAVARPLSDSIMRAHGQDPLDVAP